MKNPFAARDEGHAARYHGCQRTKEDTMDAVTPKGETQAGVEGHSHIVRPAEMEWRPTSFPDR